MFDRQHLEFDKIPPGRISASLFGSIAVKATAWLRECLHNRLFPKLEGIACK